MHGPALQKQYPHSRPGVLLIITVILHVITLIFANYYCVELISEKGPLKFHYILPNSCIVFHSLPNKFNLKGLPPLDELYFVLASTSLGILVGSVVFLAKLYIHPSSLPWTQLDLSHNISMGLICIVSTVLQSRLVKNHENFLTAYFVQHLKITGQQIKLISFGMSWKIAMGLLILSTIFYAIQTLLTCLQSRHRSRKRKRNLTHHVRFVSPAEVIIISATDQQTTPIAKASDAIADQQQEQQHVTEGDCESGSLSPEVHSTNLMVVDSRILIKKRIGSERVNYQNHHNFM